MTDLIVELSKYLMTLLFAFYTYECFSSFRGKLTPEKRAKIFKRQMCLMYLIHLDAFLAIYAVTDDIRMILFYVVQAAFIAVTISSYRPVSYTHLDVYKRQARTECQFLRQESEGAGDVCAAFRGSGED